MHKGVEEGGKEGTSEPISLTRVGVTKEGRAKCVCGKKVTAGSV